MGKNHKHQKHLKSEKAKVKLKTKSAKDKHLPKGLNITDASFKVKKIVIREQLKQQDSSEVLSRRKLNVKDLLTRLQHYNSNVRQDAVRELKEMLTTHGHDILNMQLNSLLQGICALALDKEKPIRREALKVLDHILETTPEEQIIPFSKMIISYLTCAMTHIDQYIMEDSLLFLDILLRSNNIFISNNGHKILVYFLDMISKFQSQSNPGRQLTTNLNSKTTSIKWRLKVLNSLNNFLQAIIDVKESETSCQNKNNFKEFRASEKSDQSFAIYSSNFLRICSIQIENNAVTENTTSMSLDTWKKYIESLMPLMFDSWIEVCPREKKVSCSSSQSLITNEASLLLKCITNIIQSLISHIELLEQDSEGCNTSQWLQKKFQTSFIKVLFSDFPYCQQKLEKKVRKRQEDFQEINLEDCLEHNLALCHIYVWFTSVCDSNFDTQIAERILQYLTDKLDKWNNSETSSLPQLIKLLKVLFLNANPIWYKNKKESLGSALNSMIKSYLQYPKKDLQFELFLILRDIVMDYNLISLQSEESFKEFVKSLPSLLLRESVHDSTIKMLNRVILQHKDWIQKELESNYDKILHNAKKIEIIGSDNVSSSRLMIFNLFYFMNEHVYY